MKKLSKKWKILIPSIIATSILGASVLSACAKVEKKINEEMKNNQDNKPTNENKEKDENKDNNESELFLYSNELLNELNKLKTLTKQHEITNEMFNSEFELINERKLSLDKVQELIQKIKFLVTSNDNETSNSIPPIISLEIFNKIPLRNEIIPYKRTFVYDQTQGLDEYKQNIQKVIDHNNEMIDLLKQLNIIDEIVKENRVDTSVISEYNQIKNEKYENINRFSNTLNTFIDSRQNELKHILSYKDILNNNEIQDEKLNSDRLFTNLLNNILSIDNNFRFKDLVDDNLSFSKNILNTLDSAFRTLRLEQEPNFSLRNRVINSYEKQITKLKNDLSSLNKKQIFNVQKNVNQWVYQSIFKNTDYKQDILNQFYDYFYFQSPWWNNFGIDSDQQQVITKSLELRNNTINPILETLLSLFNDHLFSQMSSNYDFDQTNESKQQDENTISQFNASMKDDENSILMYQSGLFQHPITYLKLLKQTQGFGEVINEKLNNIITNLEQYRSLIKQLEFDESLTPTQVIDWLKTLESTRFDALKTVLDNLKQDYDYLKQNHYQEWLLIASKGSTQSNEWFRNWSLKSMNHIDDEHSLDFIKEFKKTIVFEKTPNYNQQIKQLRDISAMTMLHNQLYLKSNIYKRLIDGNDQTFIKILNQLNERDFIKNRFNDQLVNMMTKMFELTKTNQLTNDVINEFNNLLVELENSLIVNNYTENIFINQNHFYFGWKNGLYSKFLKTLSKKHNKLMSTNEEYDLNTMSWTNDLNDAKQRVEKYLENKKLSNSTQTNVYEIYQFVVDNLLFNPLIKFDMIQNENEHINQLITWLNDENSIELNNFNELKQNILNYINNLKQEIGNVDLEKWMQTQVFVYSQLFNKLQELNDYSKNMPYELMFSINETFLKSLIDDNKQLKPIWLYDLRSVNTSTPSNPQFEFKKTLETSIIDNSVIVTINEIVKIFSRLYILKNNINEVLLLKFVTLDFKKEFDNDELFFNNILKNKIKQTNDLTKLENYFIWTNYQNLNEQEHKLYLSYFLDNEKITKFDKKIKELSIKDSLSQEKQQIIKTYQDFLKYGSYDMKWMKSFVEKINNFLSKTNIE